MHHATPLITTIVGGLVLAFILGMLANKLRISPLVGYLLAGVLAGPFTPGFVADTKLATELAELGTYIIEGKDIRSNETLEKHADWVDGFLPKYKEKGIAVTAGNVESILQEEVGHVFARVLEDAGVYKCDAEGREAFGRFLNSVGFSEC